MPKSPNSIRLAHRAKKGGELGDIKKGQLVGPIDKAVFTLPERELHGPIKSQFGWHLLEIKFRMD